MFRLNLQVTAYRRQTVRVGTWSGHVTRYKILGLRSYHCWA